MEAGTRHEIKKLQKELEAEKKKNHQLEEQWLKAQWEAQFQEQDEDEEVDGLKDWYEDDKVEEELLIKEKSQSSSPFIKVEESIDLSKKDILEMMMQHQERTLEKIIAATSQKEKTNANEKDRDWLEESKLRSVDIEELEDLTETSIKGTSSIKFGDWLHRITPTLKNLSRKADVYWKSCVENTQGRYQKYLLSTPRERLELKFEEDELEASEEYQKVRNVITETLLKAIPKELANEAITKRFETPEKILLFIMTKYQPGGKKERESSLRMIIEPEAKTNEAEALEGLKTWQRRLQRAKELKLNIPDASILLASVDKITEKAIKKDPRKTFRLETIREQLKVDIIPTESAVEDLSKFVQAELEEAISAQLDPKVKSITANDQKERPKTNQDGPKRAKERIKKEKMIKKERTIQKEKARKESPNPANGSVLKKDASLANSVGHITGC